MNESGIIPKAEATMPARNPYKVLSSQSRLALALAVNCFFIFVLACRLLPAHQSRETGVALARILGSARLAFSSQFIVEADRWFHRGVERFEKTGLTNWYSRSLSIIKPSLHSHRAGADTKEIMPWLLFSTKLDPSNTEAYSIAAFFLADELARSDLAEQLLRAAQRDNPRDYSLFYERGRLALKIGKLEEADRYLDAAIRAWPGERSRDDETVLMDRYLMLSLTGLLREMQGDTASAIDLYEEALRAAPSRAGLKKRLHELKSTGMSSASAFDIWKMIQSHHPHICGHQEHVEH